MRVSALVDPSVNARESVARAFPRAGQAAAIEQTAAPAGALALLTSSPGAHAAQANAAFERGWHVLCEKPLATTTVDAEAMIAAARQHGCALAVAFYKRFFPAARYLQTLCRDWLLGPLVSFSIDEGGPFRGPAEPAFFDRSQTPGGVLFDLGAHVFDLLGWWLGEPSEVRYADDAMGGLEANAFVRLSYASGIEGRVHLSRDSATAQRQRFVFERGVVSWNVQEANDLAVQLAGAPASVHGTLSSTQPVISLPLEEQALETNAQCFLQQLRNVVAALAGEESLAIPGEAALPSLRLIERCYEHRTLVAQPWFTTEESARAQELGSALSATP